MKPEKITQPDPKICNDTTVSGIMKVEHCEAKYSHFADTANLLSAFHGQDGNEARPNKSARPRAPEIHMGKEVCAMNNKTEQPAKRVVEIDTAKYQAYLDDTELSEEEKAEFIEALWSIIVSFMDMGFGIHPVQEASSPEPCGKLTQGVEGKAGKDSNESKPVQTLTDEFERASDDT